MVLYLIEVVKKDFVVCYKSEYKFKFCVGIYSGKCELFFFRLMIKM